MFVKDCINSTEYWTTDNLNIEKISYEYLDKPSLIAYTMRMVLHSYAYSLQVLKQPSKEPKFVAVKEDESDIVSTRVEDDTNISGSRPTLVKKKVGIIARSEPETGASVQPEDEKTSDKHGKPQPDATSQDNYCKSDTASKTKTSKSCIML